MAKKKKKKRKLKPRTIWALFIAYFLAGLVVAMFWLNHRAPDPAELDAAQQGMANAYGLVPIIVLTWPIFLIWLIVEIIV